MAKFLMQAILAVGCYLYLENFVPGFTTEVTIPIVKVNIDFWLVLCCFSIYYVYR